MKIKFASIVCLVVLSGVWVYIHAQTAAQAAPSTGLPTGPNGRYQIAAVEIAMGQSWGDREVKAKTVVRIDTQTGKTWRLIEYAETAPGGGPGETHLGWTELHDFK